MYTLLDIITKIYFHFIHTFNVWKLSMSVCRVYCTPIFVHTCTVSYVQRLCLPYILKNTPITGMKYVSKHKKGLKNIFFQHVSWLWVFSAWGMTTHTLASRVADDKYVPYHNSRYAFAFLYRQVHRPFPCHHAPVSSKPLGSCRAVYQ